MPHAAPPGPGACRERAARHPRAARRTNGRTPPTGRRARPRGWPHRPGTGSERTRDRRARGARVAAPRRSTGSAEASLPLSITRCDGSPGMVNPPGFDIEGPEMPLERLIVALVDRHAEEMAEEKGADAAMGDDGDVARSRPAQNRIDSGDD